MISYMFRAGTVAAAKAVLSTQSDFRGVTTGVSSNSAQDASGRAVVVPNSQVRIQGRLLTFFLAGLRRPKNAAAC